MDALTRVAKAANGLIYSSEADYPLEPFAWTDATPFAPEQLYTLTQLPASAPITKVELADFFAPMLHLDDGASDDARKRVARYQSLLRVLRRQLKAPAVYELGSVEMPTFVVGQLADGRFGGLRTTVVET